MKIIVTHASPDWDAITSVWLIKRFLPGWENAEVKFVPAGQRFRNISFINEDQNPIEHIEEDEIIHVDTGLGPLDHHQTSDMQVCAASLSWNYVKTHNSEFRIQSDRIQTKIEALERMVKVVVAVDHFQEVFWDNPTADYHEFSFLGILDGIKYQKPDQDNYYTRFGMDCLDAIIHNFENRIWAEKEIQEKGKAFKTRFGMGLGFESLNDTVIKLSQKMGYAIVIRKDPRKGYVRVKVRPSLAMQNAKRKTQNEKENIDLTPVYEKLKEIDPKATWFLHVSKKMLLNGTTKNPKMVPTTLTLDEIIQVVEKI